MKIGLVVPGGVHRSGTHSVIPCLLWFIERIARAHELHVFAMRQEPRPCRYALLGAQIHNIGARPRALNAIRAMAAEHRRGRFDVLHAIWAAPQGVVAGVAGRLLRRPVLHHLTGGDLASVPDIGYGVLRSRRGRMQLRAAVALADRVTVPSVAMQESAARRAIGAERLPFGVSRDAWPPAAPRRRLPGRPARLLHVASLNRVKDQDTLLRAASLLREHGILFRLDIIGSDTLDGHVQRLVRDLGLEDCVGFRGFLPQEELRPHMEAADLLLVSSRHEADPIVMLEAAMAGVPTVGTAVGHLRDWAPEAAIAVPVGDAAALAREIARLLEDDARRVRTASAAQKRALAQDADWTARRVLEIYEELVRTA